ncbi:MAG: hypothetical protein ACLVKO_01410 [Dysgonomonas sp.]
MNHNLEIQKILLKTDTLSSTEDKIASLRQAITIADANSDTDWGYELRDMIIRHEASLLNRKESFPAFAWMLDAYDNNPELFDEKEILHHYTWMASIAYCNAGISKKQIGDILEDYRNRLGKAGFGNRSYYELKTDWELFLGNGTEAYKNLLLRNKEAIDIFSSENGTVTEICVRMLRGEFDKGIELANQLEVNGYLNSYSLLSMYNQLIYYLNNARDKRAKIYFDRAENLLPAIEKKPYLLFEISLMMYYMSHNEQSKAWDYFEKYAHWEIDANDYSSFDFSLAVLPLLQGGGKRKMKINRKLPYHREDDTYNIKELHDYYFEKTSRLAKLFDERDENNYFSEQIKRHLQQKNRIWTTICKYKKYFFR